MVRTEHRLVFFFTFPSVKKMNFIIRSCQAAMTKDENDTRAVIPVRSRRGHPIRKLLVSLLFSIVTMLLGMLAQHVQKKILDGKDPTEGFKPPNFKAVFQGGGRSGRVLDKYQKIALTCVQTFESNGSDATPALDQIGGMRSLKEEMKSTVLMAIRHPQVFFDVSAPELSPARRVLLCGSPGTGKTMLAKAIASDAGADLVSITLGTIEDKYFGESPKILRAIFEMTKERAATKPVVLFIDELDGIMRSRRDDDQACVYGLKTEFLQMLDSLERGDRVVVIGCTNFKESLDAALLRRFNIVHDIHLPDLDDRREIIRILTEKERKFPEKLKEELAEHTFGMSGSNIKDAYERACAARMQRTLDKVHINAQTTSSDVMRKMPPMTREDWPIPPEPEEEIEEGPP